MKTIVDAEGEESDVMFFKKRKKSKSISICSPLNGKVIPLEDVPDPVFSQKMMGDGIAFIPSNGEITSPVKGKVTQVFPTQHAIGMLTEEGVELLIHLGLETVALKGEGFNIEVEVGDELGANDRIGTFDLSFIEEKGKDTTTILVFTNFSDVVKKMTVIEKGNVVVGTEVLELELE